MEETVEEGTQWGGVRAQRRGDLGHELALATNTVRREVFIAATFEGGLSRW